MRSGVLIADDQLVFRRSVVAVLLRDEFEVVAEAADAQDAVRMARRLRPALAVINVAMTGLGGVDAMRGVLRASPETRVVAVTPQPTVASLVDAVCGGARGFVAKRGTVQLVMALRALVEGKVHLAPEFVESLAEAVRRRRQLYGACSNTNLRIAAAPTPVARSR